MKNRQPGLTTKKLAIKLLAGPKSSTELKAPYPSIMQSMKDQGLVKYLGLPRSKFGKWALTTQGMRRAAQWDYQLKLDNQHPEQDEPQVTPIPKHQEEQITLDDAIAEHGYAIEESRTITEKLNAATAMPMVEQPDWAAVCERQAKEIQDFERMTEYQQKKIDEWESRYTKLAELLAAKNSQ